MMSRSLTSFLGMVLLIGLAACQPSGATDGAATPSATSESAAPAVAESAAAADTAVVEITTTDYAFTAPPTFPSGWVTLRLHNEAEQPHFLMLWRLPEDKDFADYTAEVAMPFSSLYKQYHDGTLDQGAFFEALTAALPAWFPTETRGGVGLTSPGLTSQSTVFLEPGDYVMECYVRAPDPEGDKFHGELGMLRPLIVSEEGSGAAEPEADVRVTLSNYQFAVEGELTAGEHTIAAHVAEAPEGLVGHNLNLVRLADDDRIEDVAAWMSWVDALQPPAPVELLGGAEQVSPGRTTYFTVNLQPGRYAFVSEGYGTRGMVHEFTIE